jgi:putative Holliday junction resolvase
MTYLGLDIGDKRIGVACGDAQVRIATPITVLSRDSFAHDVAALARLVRAYAVTHLVVGLPHNMDGSAGAQADTVRAYAQALAQALGLPLTLWDERLSTLEATRRMHATGARGKKSRRHLDAIAAAVILQDFLDALAHPSTEPTA